MKALRSTRVGCIGRSSGVPADRLEKLIRAVAANRPLLEAELWSPGTEGSEKLVAGRSYSIGVTAALVSLSQGTCYYPKCTIPTIVIAKDRPVLNLHRSHIVAAEPGGPRDEPTYTVEQRNRFENLILLCYPHHLLVDKLEPGNFPTHALLQWKQDREEPGLAVLNGLHGLTEERLQELLSNALDTQIASVKDAVDRLEQYDLETAQVLRGLIANLDQYQLAGSYLNLDAITMLDSAARSIRQSMDPDIVIQLNTAADKLANLPDMVAMLSDVLRRMPREY